MMDVGFKKVDNLSTSTNGPLDGKMESNGPLN
jgi:hypothetical protein